MPPGRKNNWFDFSALMGASGLRLLLSRRDDQNGGQPLAQHREILGRELGFSQGDLAVPHQVHGTQVDWADDGRVYPQTDGLLAANPEPVLTLQVADCAPVFLYHAPSRTRGLVHAGWRGLAGGVLAAAVDHLRDRDIGPGQVVAVIGPVIGPECYQVGPEVAAQFDTRFLTASPDGSYQLDLPGVVRSRLEDAGVRAENIATAGICTKCDSRCHSYRRDGQRAGRMVAFFYEQG
ncbi:MAG: polyphenol oxidase family protein [Candidatus Marinimicrobia bacterium]|nr:polyphenol oxidase family protein [Candidatus Neomarinimicrobiota bacterium]